jgi:Metallo-beta-lactamase superfamily
LIELTFLGAAQAVTGSKHLLRTSRASVLLDCGLFQGRRRESFQKNRNIPIDGTKLDAVVLSHAHIDHSGALPLLGRTGFNGPIYATSATRDLCAPMLLDAAAIQAADARHAARDQLGLPQRPGFLDAVNEVQSPASGVHTARGGPKTPQQPEGEELWTLIGHQAPKACLEERHRLWGHHGAYAIQKLLQGQFERQVSAQRDHEEQQRKQ